MGDSEAVLGLDGLKEGLEGAAEERGEKTRPSVSSCSSRGSQMEVKLPWYMGITCKVNMFTITIITFKLSRKHNMMEFKIQIFLLKFDGF